MNRFRFVPNVPQIVSLVQPEAEYDSNTGESSYQLSDGRALVLGTADATRLNLLDLQPGETFGIRKVYQDEKMVGTHLEMWLTPATEQARAQAEQLEPPAPKPVQPKPRRRKVIEMRPDVPAQPTPQQTQGTGTYGRAPMPRPAIAATATGRIPWNIAFREVAAFVAQELKQIGEQWSDQARQDAVSTILIAESKVGRITTWER